MTEQHLYTIHTPGGPDDWEYVHMSMKARGWTQNCTDSYWHAADGSRATVYRTGPCSHAVVLVEDDDLGDDTPLLDAVAEWEWNDAHSSG